MPDAASISVTVMYSPAPRVVREWRLSLPTGATVRDALRASGLQDEFPELELEGATLGLWARKCTLDAPLREDDRVEVYRPLTVDPKVARRERFRVQGARATGLFARKRAGAKAGY
jgi:putative ubiquitin-RnfH superfamily antitoxin RatB of RatAB toxin-antitoxin module